MDGDWIINDSQTLENETIILNGNLTIENGGHLIFNNVTLKMDSDSNGEFKIEVKRGGSMIIRDYDDDNTTIQDASVIESNTTYAYMFWVDEGSNFSMTNSRLHDCGEFGIVGYSPVTKTYGLHIQTDNATLDHNTISYNYYGVTCYNSDAVISNNTIRDNEEDGILSRNWSNGTIINNQLINNWIAVDVTGGSSSDTRPSFPLVKGNYMRNNDMGIAINLFSVPKIEDNIILNTVEDGIYCGQWCEVTIRNTTIDGGNYGIASSSARNVTIINCTVKNVGPWYDLSVGSATYFTTINTTFDESNVGFLNTNANLTVKWFMHPRVEDADTGSPISGANVRIRDNSNGTYDENFTTNSQGYVRWVPVTEYYQTDNNGDEDGNDSGEKILYTPYLVNASAPGYYDGSNETGIGESKIVLVELTYAPEFPILIVPVLFVLLLNIGRRLYFSG